MEDGYEILFLDESIFQIAPYITYGWFPVGSHPSIKYEYKRKEKYCVLGALNKNCFVYEIAEALNSTVFKQFISNLRAQFKKLVIVIDHAPYHVSNEMQKFYDEQSEYIHIEYFPSYSPELDPTEQSWRAIKKWLGIRYWRDKNEFKEELIAGLKQDFVIVPIYDYLLP